MPSQFSTAHSVKFLRHRAAELGLTLPPIGKTSHRWPKSLQSPAGPTVDLGSRPGTFVRRLLGHSWRPLALQTALMTMHTVAGAFIPWVMGHMLDSVISSGLSAQTWELMVVFGGIILLMSVTDGLGQLSETATWMGTALVSARSVGHQISRAGRGAKQKRPAGDIVTSLIDDTVHIGDASVWFPELVASFTAMVVIIALMFTTSAPLAWMVVSGMVISVVTVVLVARPLAAKQAKQREEQGKLTTISTDAVAGLRVLRGIGGEDFYNQRYQDQSRLVCDAGIKVAPTQAVLVMMRNSIPQALVAVVIGYGAYLAWQGEISAGVLVSFYGYTAFLRMPINAATNMVQAGTRAWVGVKKLVVFNSLQSPTSDEAVNAAVGEVDFARLPLTDKASGTVITPGVLTALVAENPDVSAALARRLGRTNDQDEILIGSTDLREIALDKVREGIYLSEADAQLFKGSLHEAIAGHYAANPSSRGVTELVYREQIEEAAVEEDVLFRDRHTEDPLADAALFVADGADVESSLRGGLSGRLAERGRNLSGGQRQRLALARGLYGDAPILIAIEPTSAVDSHTEARIAARLAERRRGKTTVIVTASPLLLDHCQEVILVDEEGHEVIRGTHQSLSQAARENNVDALRYRRIVHRGMGE